MYRFSFPSGESGTPQRLDVGRFLDRDTGLLKVSDSG